MFVFISPRRYKSSNFIFTQTCNFVVGNVKSKLMTKELDYEHANCVTTQRSRTGHKTAVPRSWSPAFPPLLYLIMNTKLYREQSLNSRAGKKSMECDTMSLSLNWYRQPRTAFWTGFGTGSGPAAYSCPELATLLLFLPPCWPCVWLGPQLVAARCIS